LQEPLSKLDDGNEQSLHPDPDAGNEADHDSAIQLLEQSLRDEAGVSSATLERSRPPNGIHKSHLDSDLQVEETLAPAMSHRDRALRQRERRREEKRLRFEEEARRIRDESWVRSRSKTRLGLAKDIMMDSSGQGRAQGRGQAETTGHTSVSWLLDCEHIHPANLANPFNNCNPKVFHSPRQTRHAENSQGGWRVPSPPPPHYGHHEPPVPHVAPPSNLWTSWRTGEAQQQQQHPARLSQGLRLESLGARQVSHQESEGRTDCEDTDTSCSISELDDGLSDVSVPYGRGWASDGLSRRRSQELQQQIDKCRAAIYRHKMTIEMLQYTFAQESEAAYERQAQAPESFPANSGDEASAAAIPAVVRDAVARLVRRCLEGLGRETFLAARHCLQASLDMAETPNSVRSKMLELLGVDKIGFLSLIDQIVQMERRWGPQDAS